MKPIKTFAFKDRLRGHKDAVVGLAAPNGAEGGILLSGSKEGRFRAWDLNQRTILSKMYLNKRGVQIEEKQQDVQDDNEEAKQITYQASNPTGHKDIINTFFFTEKTIYAGYEDGSVLAWSISSGDVLFELVGHTKQVNKLLQLNPRIVASCSNDGTIICWDNIDGKCESVIKMPGPVNTMMLENNIIYALCSNNKLVKINSETLEHVLTFDLDDMVVTAFLVENGNYYFGTTKRTIEILSSATEDGKEKLVSKGSLLQHESWILCIGKQGEYLFSGADDKKIKVWNLTEMKQVEEFLGHKDGVTCLEFCDRMLYSGSYDHSIRSWDLQEMVRRILDRKIMMKEELFSQRLEAYMGVINKGKKKGGKKKKKGKK